MDTTLFAQTNEKYKYFERGISDLDYAVITHALRDYDSIMQYLDEVVVLKEFIKAQEAEIIRLYKEKNDYEYKYTYLANELEEYKAYEQASAAQTAEYTAMITKLLHALKTASTRSAYLAYDNKPVQSDSDDDSSAYDQIYHEFKIPHNGYYDRNAIIINGRTERMKEDGDDFPPLTKEQRRNKREYERLFGAGDTGQQENQGDDMDLLASKMNYRVLALTAERDGITKMMIYRLVDLQAQLTGLRREQSKTLEEQEESLLNKLEQLIENTKLKTDTEQQCLELEHKMGEIAAKYYAKAQKAREGAYNIIDTAKARLKTHEQNKQQEMRLFRHEMNQKFKEEMEEIKAQINDRDEELKQLETLVQQLEERDARLNKRISDLEHENNCCEETLRRLY